MLYVYQLVAEGELLAGVADANPAHSSTVFATKEAAVKRIPAFRAIATDRARLFAYVAETLQVKIVSLEVIEE